jgi:hypothetical protein
MIGHQQVLEYWPTEFLHCNSDKTPSQICSTAMDFTLKFNSLESRIPERNGISEDGDFVNATFQNQTTEI